MLGTTKTVSAIVIPAPDSLPPVPPDMRPTRICPSLSAYVGRRWLTSHVLPAHLRLVDVSFRCEKRPGVEITADYVADLCLGRLSPDSCLFLEDD